MKLKKIWRRLGVSIGLVCICITPPIHKNMPVMAMEKEVGKECQVERIEIVSCSAIIPKPSLIPMPATAASMSALAINPVNDNIFYWVSNSVIVVEEPEISLAGVLAPTPTIVPTPTPTSIVMTPTVELTSTPKPTKKPRKKKKTSEFSKYKNEEYLFAQMIMCEVGGSTETDMVYAGSVILNRARTGYRDFAKVNSISEVLYQGYGTKLQQYASATIRKIEGGIRPTKEVKKVAKGLLNGGIKCLDESVLYQTEFVPTWNVKVVKLPGKYLEVYSSPTDFEEYRKARKKKK